MPGYATVWGGGVASQVSMVQQWPAITAASTTILAQDANRKYIAIQNNSSEGKNLRLNFQAAATVVSMRLQPGQVWVPNAVPTDAINAMGELAGAGAAILANEVSVITGS